MSIDVISRWIHIWFATVAIGGAVFQWFALLPALKYVSDEQRAVIRERVNSRWGKVIAVSALLLILTGFYNYLVVMRPAHKGDGIYHMLMGIKILLAFAVFFFASALSGRSAKFEKFRRNSGVWLLLTIILMAGVVAIGGYLKVARPPVAKVVVETAPAAI